MSLERVRIKLPDGFDPGRHAKALGKLIAERHGDGFEIESIDPVARTAFATRQATITEVTAAEESPDSFEVRLPRGTKPSDGDRVAVRLASQYGDGYEMTSFDPYLGKAVLSKLDPAAIRCRGAVAVALSVKPWDIAITPRTDGGFDLRLPHNYVPSKHDEKLDEVATAVIGQDGWYVEVNPAGLTASIIPGTPPSFPPVVPYPFKTPPEFDPTNDAWAHIPIGIRLGRTDGEDGDELVTDFVMSPHSLTQGLTGSGKGMTIMSLLTGALARGWQVTISDAIKGGVDYADFEKFVRPGGWGDDLYSACCVLNMAYAEGIRRKALIKRAGVQKWTQLPASEGLRPIMVVIDELTSLVASEPTPKGVSKDNPLVVEASERNLLKATILSTISKIAREQRFTGVALVIGTQVASTSTGIPTELRANLGAKILLGSKPTDNNRRLALNDPDAVPKVPLNIVNDPSGASRGVGVYEFEGQEPGVFKSYFAEPANYATWLAAQGVPTTNRPRPTAAEIAMHTPSLDVNAGGSAHDHSGGGDPSRSGDRSPSGRRVDPTRDPETGEILHGFAKANQQRRLLDSAASAGPGTQLADS